MEIERKFLIDRFPDLPELGRAYMEQGYLCTHPVVRIRMARTEKGERYVLCIKGKGTLAREEFEVEINRETYEGLSRLLEAAPIGKEHRVYALSDGHRLECNLVDEGEPTSFFYAEVEFSSVEEAKRFVPPACVGEDITERPGSSMSSYWEMKKRVYPRGEEENK